MSQKEKGLSPQECRLELFNTLLGTVNEHPASTLKTLLDHLTFDMTSHEIINHLKSVCTLTNEELDTFCFYASQNKRDLLVYEIANFIKDKQ